VGPIPLEHGELREVQRTPFPVPPAVAYLIDPSQTGGKEAFHAYFRRRVKDPGAGRHDIDM
jgi:hypothetical protein